MADKSFKQYKLYKVQIYMQKIHLKYGILYTLFFSPNREKMSNVKICNHDITTGIILKDNQRYKSFYVL